MTLRIRRFLYISFILLFLIISPLVCLYASGYDLNFKNLALQKTGMLILDSSPRGAQVTVKSEVNNFNLSTIVSKIFLISDKIYTPAKIKKLIPGEYTINIQTAGYWTWEKKLSIAPGDSTFAENIKLFKNDTPVLASQGKINLTIISNNGNYMLLDRGRDAILLSLSDVNELWPMVKNNLKTEPAWSTDDKKILVGSNVYNINDLLLDNNAEPFNNLSDFISTSSKMIKWGYGNNIYYIINNNGKGRKNNTELIEVNIDAKSSKTIFTDKIILDYLPSGNRLITIEKSNRNSLLNIYNSNNFKLTRTINLPAGDYSFKKTFNNYLILSDSNNNIYILDPEADEQSVLKNKLENADNLIWVDKEKIVYYNDFEIWQFNISTGEKKIITRISSKITVVYLLPSQDYIIYATEKNVYAIELDERDRRNLTKLVEMDEIKFPIINNSGDTLYFYSKLNQTEGYFRLQIR